MKKIIYLLFTLIIASPVIKAQTTAMDFTMDDCLNGDTYHFFDVLDSDNVVIMEFFMTCSSCVTAAHEIEAMQNQLNNEFPGKVKFYQIAFTNSYTCATILSWYTTNGFNAIPFDSGGTLVAYYGGFGMPTVAVAAGPNHQVLFTDVGWSTGDTTLIAAAVRNYYNTASVNEISTSQNNSLEVFPNPAEQFITVKIPVDKSSHLQLQLTDVSGKIVKDIFNDEISAGIFEMKVDISSLAIGTYMIKAAMNNRTTFSKVNIAK